MRRKGKSQEKQNSWRRTHSWSFAGSRGLVAGPLRRLLPNSSFGVPLASYAFREVPFRPGRQMLTGREPAVFLTVTLAVRQHEVVRQIHRVAGPSDKVVCMSCVP